MSSVEFDDLVAAHGFEKAQELFETFKTSKPTTEISPDFAMQIVARLSDLYVKIEKIEWGLENPDSDSYLEWCEHYHLIIPQFDAQVLIEVDNSHYYVRFESGGGDSDDDTFKYWEDIPEFIARCVQVFHGTLYAQLVMDESREFPFGVLTFADGLCVDSVDDFWHATNEDRARSVQAWGYIVVNQGEENAQNGIEPPKDFDEFLDVYGFVENTGKFACGGSIDDKSYGWETFSPDIDEVVKIANSELGRVHTVVDGDDGRLWLTSGYHLVNRIFYIITQKPYLGPDFDIPCEEPKDFNRLSLEEFKAMDPDEEIYWAEHGGYYDKQALLDLAKGDESLAYRLYALCEWQCPETLLDEDRSAAPEDRVFPELF